MLSPLVIAVILNTNRRNDTLECLDSLLRNSYPNLKVIVLDNHSTDGSVAAISEAYPDTQIIELATNLGYAGNNNVGIKAALEQGAEWVLVLNEDIILDSECVRELMEIGEQDDLIGILGPLVYHYHEPHVIQSAGGLLGRYWQSIHIGKNELDQGQYQLPHAVEWISGCAILVRREAIEQAGMLDQDYFIYWEETEWCIRIGRAGWKVVNVPRARIWHKGVQRDYEPKPSFTYYGTRNHLLTLAKHNAPLGARFSTWIQILRTLASWSIRPKWRNKRDHRDAMWRGVIDYLRQRWGAMPPKSMHVQ
jgi:GT2 family glycosyltransferase